jgi:thiamine biosynthesis lipoprotein
LLVLISLAACAPEESTYRKSSIIMDTLVTITVVSDSRQEAEDALEAAFDEIRRLEELLSFWTEDSEIAAIYQNAGVRPVRVSPETLEVVERSLHIAEKTGGAFDPTVGPVMRLWDFREKRMPAKKEIEGKLGLVDYRKVVVDREDSTVYLEAKGMSFDTGGIAKGYAVDRAVEVLKERGMESGLVAIAGDIRGFGPRKWRIGIRDPRGEGDEDVMAVLELKDRAVSTSGDYERYFALEGKRYHHLLDPETGLPARGVWSASVIAGEAVLTDGFSTGIFVMGPDRGLALLESLGMEAVVVAEGGDAHTTSGIRDRITWQK